MYIDDIILKFNLKPKKVRGREEYEIYRNFVADVPRENILSVINHFCNKSARIFRKNDAKASQLSALGKMAFDKKEYSASIDLYSKSLRYVTHKSFEYAKTLAIRSASYFEFKDYKSCIQDIDSSFSEGFSNVLLKPRMLLRKSECYNNLGDVPEMEAGKVEAMKLISTANVGPVAKEQYRSGFRELEKSQAAPRPVERQRFDVLPDEMDKNPTFLNASSSVALQCNKRKGCHVVAKKDISRGNVLFIEKAFAWTPLILNSSKELFTENVYPGDILQKFCQYCLAILTRSIPCKECAEFVYCNEKCRDSAWDEFHQWECLAIQMNFFNFDDIGLLSLRIVLKAAHSGLVTDKKSSEQLMANFGSEDNNYPYVYNIRNFLTKLKKEELKSHAAFADILVNYLHQKTNFFVYMKKSPAFADKSEQELMNKIGGLIIRHRVQITSHSIRVKTSNAPAEILDEATIANAICPSMAMMNHCCFPNTSFYFVGDVVVVKALVDIKVNEEIYYSYSGAYLTRLSRRIQQDLVKNVFFSNCQCGLCTNQLMGLDALDSYMCIQCKGPTRLVFNNQEKPYYVCWYCNQHFNLPLEKYLLQREAIESFNEFGITDDVKKAEIALKSIESIYRASHNDILLVRGLIHDYYKRAAEIKSYLDISKRILESCCLRNQWYSINNGLMRLTILQEAVRILKGTWKQLPTDIFEKIVSDLTFCSEEASEIFNFHYPPFISYLLDIQDELEELRISFMERVIFNSGGKQLAL